MYKDHVSLLHSMLKVHRKAWKIDGESGKGDDDEGGGRGCRGHVVVRVKGEMWC